RSRVPRATCSPPYRHPHCRSPGLNKTAEQVACHGTTRLSHATRRPEFARKQRKFWQSNDPGAGLRAPRAARRANPSSVPVAGRAALGDLTLMLGKHARVALARPARDDAAFTVSNGGKTGAREVGVVRRLRTERRARNARALTEIRVDRLGHQTCD